MSAPPFASLAAFATRLGELVPDNKWNLAKSDYVKEALRLYSQDHPAIETQDIGDGSTTAWDLTATPFTRWEQGFSERFPVAVEYLSGSAIQRPQVWLRPDVDFWIDHRYVSATLKPYLVFLDAPPATTEQARVHFRRRWLVDDATPTPTVEVPLHHQEAVVKRAAAYYCEVIAANYARTIDASSGSDLYNARDTVEMYRTMRKQFLDAYADAIGLGGRSSFRASQVRTGIPRVFDRGYK